jgi:hypothetical protein
VFIAMSRPEVEAAKETTDMSTADHARRILLILLTERHDDDAEDERGAVVPLRRTDARGAMTRTRPDRGAGFELDGRGRELPA